MNKSELRQQLKNKVSHLTPQERASQSEQITQLVLSLSLLNTCSRCAIYYPLPHEVNTIALIQALHQRGINCFLPTVEPKRQLNFYAYYPQDKLKENTFGILEPIKHSNKQCPIDALDLIFCPLIGFDEQGYRLGTGGGYYDTTFANHQSVPMMGLAFECQKVKQLPIDPWDRPLSSIITETQIYSCSSS